MNDSSASWRGSVALSEADARPGAYYVTARDEARNRTAFLIGPFVQRTPGQTAHAQALGYVQAAKRRVMDLDHTNGPWLTYGTSRLARFTDLPEGKLNQEILP